MALSKTAQEILWVDSWNNLYDLLRENETLILVDADWSEISLGEAESIIQNHAYDSQKVDFERTWYRGKPALRLTFSAALQ